MDEVDRKQQEEINALQKKDVFHDRDLWWMKIVGLVIVMWTLVSTYLVMESMELIKKAVVKEPEKVVGK